MKGAAGGLSPAVIGAMAAEATVQSLAKSHMKQLRDDDEGVYEQTEEGGKEKEREEEEQHEKK